MNRLNSFTELRTLEVLGFESDYNSRACRLALEKLEFFRFVRKKNILPVVELETPKLTSIDCQLNLVKLNYPEVVEVLTTDYCDKRGLKKLVNLQYLFTKQIASIEDDFLLNLKNLKAVQFFKSGDRSNVFHKLHQQKQQLNKHDLRIYFLGIEFEESEYPIYDLDPQHASRFNSKQLGRFYRDDPTNRHDHFFQKLFSEYELNEHNCKLYFSNSSRIAPVIPFVKRLRYRLVDVNRDKLSFFSRFTNIREIIVNGELTDPAFFLEFISNQSRLQALKFNESKFNQFEALVRFVPKLIELCIQNEPNVLNFEFVLKLQNLMVLKTDQSIPFEIVKQLCYDSQTISVVFFNYKSSQIQIGCDDKSMCSLFVHSPLDAQPQMIHDVTDLENLLVDVGRFIEFN